MTVSDDNTYKVGMHVYICSSFFVLWKVHSREANTQHTHEQMRQKCTIGTNRYTGTAVRGIEWLYGAFRFQSALCANVRYCGTTVRFRRVRHTERLQFHK